MSEQMDASGDLINSESRRLKYLAQINPSKSEISDLPPDTNVSFVELDDFGTAGEITNRETRPLNEVYDGYTYFQEGDIAIAKITPSFENGKGAICDGLKNEIGFGTTELHIIRPDENVCTEFLWYVLRSKPFMSEAKTAMRGVAGQQRVPTEYLENYEVPLYPINKQEEISIFLNKWNKVLSNLLYKSNTLQELIRLRRMSMITHEVTGNRIDVANVPVESEWFDSLPRRWETIRLKFLLKDLEQGWSPQCNEVPSDANEWGILKTSCVNDIYFDSSGNKQLPGNLAPRPELEVKQNDVIISRANAKNLVGSCAIARNPDPKLMLSDKLYRLQWDHSICLPEFLAYALNSSFIREQISLKSSGFSDSMVNISKESIKNLQIPLPPIEDQEQIIRSLDKGISTTRDLEQSTSRLNELISEKRQELITAAVSGQIDVTEAQGLEHEQTP